MLVGARPEEVDDALRVEERPKEAETLDVVEVHVREEDEDLLDPFPLQVGAELADARPRIEDDDLPGSGPNLDAVRVASIANGRGSRRGKRAAAPPDNRPHGVSPT